MKRIHFLVRLYDLRIHASQGIPQGTLVKPVLTMDFAKYKKFVFSHWKWKSNTHDWETSYTQSNPFYFHYRTDYAELLEPKQLIFEHGASSGANGVRDSHIRISLHTLATGPEEYHFPSLSFKCQMYQDCVIKYQIHRLVCPWIDLPFPIQSHPNYFWFEPKFSLEIWYVSGERMTFCGKIECPSSSKKKDVLVWNSPRPFFVSDTTDMLEKAHFFIQLYYNDRPLAYSLVHLFQNFNPKSHGPYLFHAPIHLYKSSLSKGATKRAPDPSFDLNLVIQEGPSFWPMKGGSVNENVVVHGESKPYFPFPTSVTSIHKSLSSLDTNQKQLLRHYFLLGFSKEWTRQHLAELIHAM